MTTTEKKLITITLSDRPPVRVAPEDWPVIAHADDHDGKVQCQANTEWEIKVREHADGRRIVYGWVVAGNGGKPIGWRGATGGFLIPKPDVLPNRDGTTTRDEETIRAIRRVAGIIGRPDLADDAIADLPPEVLT